MCKTALITGATSGIGKAYAYALAQKGYNLILTGRRREKIEAVAREIRRKYKNRVTVCLVDFSNTSERNAFIKFVKHCAIDFLINNAGYGAEESFVVDQYVTQEAMIKVHILATTELCHIVANQMKIRKEGTIINVSSLASQLVLPTSAMYCATKAFLTSFTQSLALELNPHGIRVQALCPGFVHTDFHSKLAINENNCQNKGPIRWMDADTLVKHSLKSLDKPFNFICIPGTWNQVGYHLLKLVPKKLYYQIVTYFSK